MNWWICGTILWNYKRVILWFDLLERLIDWICNNVILTRTQDILQFGWGMDRRSLKRNHDESLAMSLLEILCSSRSSCFSCFLRLRRFVVKVFQGFKGLNSFTDLWFVEVSGGFWAWFQQTLGSRQIVWMILLWMFFNFGVEVLEVLEGFKAWFL